MSRRKFTLTDEQATALLAALRLVDERCPPSTQSNRPYLGEFIRAVHQVTGKTVSPAIYRRLLNAYAPERRPSTTTLALEKELFEREMANTAQAAVMPPSSRPAQPAPGARLAAVDVGEMARIVSKAVVETLERHAGEGNDRWLGEQRMAQNHIADLSARLAASELALSGMHTRAEGLAAELHFAHEATTRCQAQVQAGERALQVQAEAHALALNRIAVELEDFRKFAMRAIDDVRGETRAERDRRIHAEELLKKNEKMTELFRQMAYQRGGAVPPELHLERK